jgi:hypothetical protein
MAHPDHQASSDDVSNNVCAQEGFLHPEAKEVKDG